MQFYPSKNITYENAVDIIYRYYIPFSPDMVIGCRCNLWTRGNVRKCKTSIINSNDCLKTIQLI